MIETLLKDIDEMKDAGARVVERPCTLVKSWYANLAMTNLRRERIRFRVVGFLP